MASPLHASASNNRRLLSSNTTRPPFQRCRIRRAFSLVIDRDRIVPQVMKGGAIPAHSVTRPGRTVWPPPMIDTIRPRRAVCCRAGFSGGKDFPQQNTGWVQKRPFRIARSVSKHGKPNSESASTQQNEDKDSTMRSRQKTSNSPAPVTSAAVNAPEVA